MSETSERLFAITDENMEDWSGAFFLDADTARTALSERQAAIESGDEVSISDALTLEEIHVNIPLRINRLVSLLNNGPASIITKRKVIEIAYLNKKA